MADELDLAAERISEKEAAEQKRRADLYDELVVALDNLLQEMVEKDANMGMDGHDSQAVNTAMTILAKCKGEKA